jgi:hypothetical protein
MKQGQMYKLVRFIFGLYLIWVGLNNLYRIEEYDKSVKNTINNFENIFSIEGIVDFLNIKDYVPLETLEKIKNFHVNFDIIRNSSTDIVYLMNFSLIIGGLLGALGYRISFSFSLIGIILNILFIHNFFYFRDEKMKINVLKMISLLGGIFFMS